MSQPVAFILGYGPNIGKSVATFLQGKGYRVAAGSRSPNLETAEADGVIAVTVDVAVQSSVVAAFATITAQLGAPAIVVYNVASFHAPPVLGDPLSLPFAAFAAACAVGAGVFGVAQQALAGLRAARAAGRPRALIVTGNALPFFPPAKPLFIGLGIQKCLEARLVEFFAAAYAREDIRFHYATLVSRTGGAPPADVFAGSGPTHAEVYWELVSGARKNWDYRFTEDGEKFAGYD